jgi:hypothetical protein
MISARLSRAFCASRWRAGDALGEIYMSAPFLSRLPNKKSLRQTKQFVANCSPASQRREVRQMAYDSDLLLVGGR